MLLFCASHVWTGPEPRVLPSSSSARSSAPSTRPFCAKEAERPAAQIDPAAADQGRLPSNKVHAEAGSQPHDDMPALIDSDDDKGSDDDQVSDQGRPVLKMHA